MDEKFRKQMRETFVRGNEFYAGQKPNGAIARIIKDYTWSSKYEKVVPRKGRYALIFQDIGGGGQVIAFPPEQLEAALSDLKQQGYEQLVGAKPAATVRKPVVKEPWQMTQEEYVIHFATAREKAHEMYGKPAGKTLDIALVVETAKEVHGKMVEDALQKGFPVPKEVLKDYPDLMPKHEHKPRPLPPDAQNIQSVPFDSQLFDCYGKQTKRGFRAYCRRE